MADNKLPILEVEGVKLIYRNFSGAPSQFNADGDRNFCFIIEDEKQAEELKKDGWNVKTRETEDGQFSFLKVKVNMDSSWPPRIKMIIGDKAVTIDKNNIDLLDGADIQYADIVINPYEWEVNGNTGISAYLSELYVVCNSSRIGEKYQEYEEI